MLDDVIVMGLAAWLTELLKQKGLSKEWLPLPVLALTAILNVLNGVVFDQSVPWREALKAGIQMGAVTAGIYGLGQAVKSGGQTQEDIVTSQPNR